MTHVNIHGEPFDFEAARAKAPEYRKVVGNHGKRKEPQPLGHAAPPGGGPEGKTCADCDFKTTVHARGGGRSWVKCGANKANWTHGRGSDILASSRACIKFVPKEK